MPDRALISTCRKLSLTAVLRGIVTANHRLAEMPLRRPVRFGRVQFVERYEDVAIEAVHALRRVTSRSSDASLAAERIVAMPLLGTVEIDDEHEDRHKS